MLSKDHWCYISQNCIPSLFLLFCYKAVNLATDMQMILAILLSKLSRNLSLSEIEQAEAQTGKISQVYVVWRLLKR